MVDEARAGPQRRDERDATGRQADGKPNKELLAAPSREGVTKQSTRLGFEIT